MQYVFLRKKNSQGRFGLVLKENKEKEIFLSIEIHLNEQQKTKQKKKKKWEKRWKEGPAVEEIIMALDFIQDEGRELA